jgi:hypothetical protein
MKPSTSVTLVAAALVALSLAPFARQAEAADSAYELGLHVSATSLSAVNTSDAPIVLVLRGRADARESRVVIPARGRFDTRFTPGTLRDLELIVVTRRENHLRRSEAFALDALRDRGYDALWFDFEPAKVSAWAREGERFDGIDHQGRLNGEPTHGRSAPAALHVPVITPNDGQPRETPPRLERLPLPPV